MYNRLKAALLTIGLLLAATPSVFAQNPVTVVNTPAVTCTLCATAAKQPALGTAGAASADVITIQGIAGGTVVPISGTITANLGTIAGAFLDATFTGRMPAGASPANGETNTVTSLSRIGGYNFIFNGTTWDRWTGAITAASLPLPTLAATSTKQSDGTAKTQLVDGSGNVIASTSNNLNVQCANCSGSGASAVDNATITESSSTFAPIGAEFQTTPGTVTTGHQAMLAMTAKRALQVSLFDTSGNAVTASVDATTNTTTQTTGPQLFVNGSAAAPTSAGADGRSIALWGDLKGRVQVNGDASMVALKTDPSGVTSPVSLASVPSHAVTNAGTFAAQVTQAPTAASGDAVSACNILATASTNSISCKGSAGNLFGYELYNTTTTVYYLRLYNASSAPTCSSATGFIRSIPIPPAAAAGGVGGAIKAVGAFGVQFGTGIGYCITGGSTSTDNTNAATGVFGEIDYKH